MDDIRHSYLIRTTPRSGSRVLARALTAASLAGRPEECVPPDVDRVAALGRRIARDGAAIGRFDARGGFPAVPVGCETLAGARARL